MTNTTNIEPGSVEEKVVTALLASGDKAVTESQLKSMSGVYGNSFKEAMIRLVRKNIAIKWKDEDQVNHVVHSDFRHSAHYYRNVTIDPLYLAMGHTQQTLSIRRSIPFVVSDDAEINITKMNRYQVLR
jgi:hypothetical protein